MKFKLNELVRIIGTEGTHQYSRGDTGIVREIDPEDHVAYYIVSQLDPDEGWWVAEHELEIETPCFYCEQGAENKVIPCNGDLAISLSTGKATLSYHPESGMVGLKEIARINYCPMCGKKIKT